MRHLLFTISLLFIISINSFGQTPDTDQPSSSEIAAMSFETLQEVMKDFGDNKRIFLPYYEAYDQKAKENLGANSEAYHKILSELTYAYEELKIYDKTDVFYHKLLENANLIWTKKSPQYILILCYHGDFLKVIGNYREAEPKLVEALSSGKKNREAFKIEEYAALHGFLGNYYRQTYQYEKALPLYIEAEKIQKQDEKSTEYGAILSNLADTYRRIGQIDRAIEIHKDAIAVTEKYHGTNNFGYGQRINNLVVTYPKTRANKSTLDSLYQISIENARQILGEEHPEYAIRLENKAGFHAQFKEFEQVKSIFETSRPILEKYINKRHRIWIGGLNSYCFALWFTGEKEKAIDLLLETITEKEGIYEFTKTHFTHVKSIGWMFENHGLDDLAHSFISQKNDYYVNVMKHQFEHFSEDEQIEFGKRIQTEFDKYESYVDRHPDNQQLKEQCFNNQLLLKKTLLTNTNRLNQSFEYADGQTKANFETWKQLKKQLAEIYSLPISKRNIDLDSLVNQTNELESLLARQSIPFKKATQFRNWREVQANLKEGEIAIEFVRFSYFPDDNHSSDSVYYVAYTLNKNDLFPQRISLFEAQDIPNLKQTRSIYTLPNTSAQTNNLHELIWQPIAQKLEGIHTIYYALTGVLNNINLGAIPVNELKTLAETYELHNLESTRQLAISENKKAYIQTEVLILGGIQYGANGTTIIANVITEENDSEKTRSISNVLDQEDYQALRDKDWPYLEWTAKEADDLQKLLQRSGISATTLKGQHANEVTFKEIGRKNPSPRILHLATHGYFFPEIDTVSDSGFKTAKNPLIRSGLILAGGNLAWKGGNTLDQEEDGILTAYEIAQMDLSNTELVVLSACDTGLGDIRGSEGVYGLQRAFKMAGVKYVLMSLWNVKDKKTYEFMTLFYESYLTNKTITQAYQIAQVELSKKYALPFNPKNWAGFILLE